MKHLLACFVSAGANHSISRFLYNNTITGCRESIYVSIYLQVQISSSDLPGTAEIPTIIFIYCQAFQINQRFKHSYWIIPYIPKSVVQYLHKLQNSEVSLDIN